MTLSQFLRDYLYIPLGGNRHGRILRYVNLMLTMALGGLCMVPPGRLSSGACCTAPISASTTPGTILDRRSRRASRRRLILQRSS